MDTLFERPRSDRTEEARENLTWLLLNCLLFNFNALERHRLGGGSALVDVARVLGMPTSDRAMAEGLQLELLANT